MKNLLQTGTSELIKVEHSVIIQLEQAQILKVDSLIGQLQINNHTTSLTVFGIATANIHSYSTNQEEIN